MEDTQLKIATIILVNRNENLPKVELFKDSVLVAKSFLFQMNLDTNGFDDAL